MWYSAANGQLLRLQQLVSRGLWIDESDYDGRTAMHLAASEGHLECLRYLIALGGDMTPVDRFGFTPLQDAEREERRDCISLLKEELGAAEGNRARRMYSDDGEYMERAIDDPVKQALVHAFRHIKVAPGEHASKEELVHALIAAGLAVDDPRLSTLLVSLPDTFNCKTWVETLLSYPTPIVTEALTGRLVIPDFADYTQMSDKIHDAVRDQVNQGQVASGYHSTELVENMFGVAACTTSGQHCGHGDNEEKFVIGEIAAALTYCIAQDLYGSEHVHKYVSYEPSGRAADEIALSQDGRPHNPLVNAGALVTLTMLHPELDIEDRFAKIRAKFAAAAGISDLSNSDQFRRDRPGADRNFCLAYMLQENGCFPKDQKQSDLINATIDLFYMAASIQMNCKQLATVASTLANGGVCAITNQRVFNQESVRNCLAVMFSCGCDSYSGEFAFRVGIPAKSSSSGCTLLVCPNTVGTCVWSPKLNDNRCSTRGVAFAHLLVSRYKFHAFETGAVGLSGLVSETGTIDHEAGARSRRMERIAKLAIATDEERLLMKADITSLTDPTVHPTAAYEASVSAALLAASTGDIVRRHLSLCRQSCRKQHSTLWSSMHQALLLCATNLPPCCRSMSYENSNLRGLMCLMSPTTTRVR
eukprot:COSAG02_NODE_4612_length_5167_cov_52.768153_1_plen_646_part_00